MKVAAKIAVVVGTLVVLAILLRPMALGVLLFGWAEALDRLSATVTLDPIAVLSAAVCALLVGIGLHALGAWAYRAAAPAGTARRWHIRWTGAALLALLLMFSTGMAAAALARHVLWVARSPRPLYGSCPSNMRQLGQAMYMYARDHGGRFPDSLADLCAAGEIDHADMFLCPNANDEMPLGDTPQQWAEQLRRPGHCSYVYIGQDLTQPASAERPVLYEPLANHDGDGSHVLFGDGHVEWIAAPAVKKMVKPFLSATTQPAP